MKLLFQPGPDNLRCMSRKWSSLQFSAVTSTYSWGLKQILNLITQAPPGFFTLTLGALVFYLNQFNSFLTLNICWSVPQLQTWHWTDKGNYLQDRCWLYPVLLSGILFWILLLLINNLHDKHKITQIPWVGMIEILYNGPKHCCVNVLLP